MPDVYDLLNKEFGIIKELSEENYCWYNNKLYLLKKKIGDVALITNDEGEKLTVKIKDLKPHITELDIINVLDLIIEKVNKHLKDTGKFKVILTEKWTFPGIQLSSEIELFYDDKSVVKFEEKNKIQAILKLLFFVKSVMEKQ